MTRIAVLTPDPADKSYIGRWPEVLARLKATLETTGAEITPTPWTDHVEDASWLETEVTTEALDLLRNRGTSSTDGTIAIGPTDTGLELGQLEGVQNPARDS